MSYQRGISGFAESSRWNWLLASGPGQNLPMSGVSAPASNGLGCPGCAGTCSDNSGLSGYRGLGQGLFGTGLFESINPSTWGMGEWTVVGLVAFAGFQALSSHPATKKRAGQGSSMLTSLLLFGVPVGLWYLFTNYTITPNSGVGDYQAQGYVQPQILTSPGRNSQIRIPAGW